MYVTRYILLCRFGGNLFLTHFWFKTSKALNMQPTFSPPNREQNTELHMCENCVFITIVWCASFLGHYFLPILPQRLKVGEQRKDSKL